MLLESGGNVPPRDPHCVPPSETPWTSGRAEYGLNVLVDNRSVYVWLAHYASMYAEPL